MLDDTEQRTNLGESQATRRIKTKDNFYKLEKRNCERNAIVRYST